MSFFDGALPMYALTESDSCQCPVNNTISLYYNICNVDYMDSLLLDDEVIMYVEPFICTEFIACVFVKVASFSVKY